MIRYVIWSKEHAGWWRPNKSGYTSILGDAGRYDKKQAGEIVDEANRFGIEDVAIIDPDSVTPDDVAPLQSHTIAVLML